LLGHEVGIGGVMLRIIEHCSQVFELTIKLDTVEDLSGLPC
jgi:hypothetical protein